MQKKELSLTQALLSSVYVKNNSRTAIFKHSATVPVFEQQDMQI